MFQDRNIHDLGDELSEVDSSSSSSEDASDPIFQDHRTISINHVPELKNQQEKNELEQGGRPLGEEPDDSSMNSTEKSAIYQVMVQNFPESIHRADPQSESANNQVELPNLWPYNQHTDKQRPSNLPNLHHNKGENIRPAFVNNHVPDINSEQTPQYNRNNSHQKNPAQYYIDAPSSKELQSRPGYEIPVINASSSDTSKENRPDRSMESPAIIYNPNQHQENYPDHPDQNRAGLQGLMPEDRNAKFSEEQIRNLNLPRPIADIQSRTMLPDLIYPVQRQAERNAHGQEQAKTNIHYQQQANRNILPPVQDTPTAISPSSNKRPIEPAHIHLPAREDRKSEEMENSLVQNPRFARPPQDIELPSIQVNPINPDKSSTYDYEKAFSIFTNFERRNTNKGKSLIGKIMCCFRSPEPSYMDNIKAFGNLKFDLNNNSHIYLLKYCLYIFKVEDSRSIDLANPVDHLTKSSKMSKSLAVTIRYNCILLSILMLLYLYNQKPNEFDGLCELASEHDIPLLLLLTNENAVLVNRKDTKIQINNPDEPIRDYFDHALEYIKENIQRISRIRWNAVPIY